MSLIDQYGAKRLRRLFGYTKTNAKRRGVGFLLSFEDWVGLWEASGQFSKIGTRKGCYQMARTGDRGPYVIGNVRICTREENTEERWSVPEAVKRHSLTLWGNSRGKGNKGKKRTPEQRARYSRGMENYAQMRRDRQYVALMKALQHG